MNEKIIEVLKDVTKAKGIIAINDMLGFSSAEDLKSVQEELNKLVESGIVHETRKGDYLLLDNCSSLKVGKLSVNKSGNGFVIMPGNTDIFVAKENLNGAINSDMVEIDVAKNHNGEEGKVIRILKRDLKNVVGEITFKKNVLVFVPDDEKLDLQIDLIKESTMRCVDGHKVLVELIREVSEKRYLGKVIRIIGHKSDPGVDILSIALRHGLVTEFPDELIAELEKLPSEVDELDLVGRKDLTKEEIFTIDGDDTKDIDDAISLEKLDGIFRLGVHIADVSNYVKNGTELYNCAYERGTSSYLADTVLPMIPHQLSNGICSLNEFTKRLTISCVMDIDYKGHVVDYEIFPSFIESKKKMTYKNVNKILMENIVPDGYEPFANTLRNMGELAKILRTEKTNRGYIDFGIEEAKVVQDETGKAIDIVKRTRGVGENLIEDFMIAANETVAMQITNMELPFIYRVHDIPSTEKIEDFVNLVKQLGYKINTNLNKVTPVTMQKILEELRDKKEFPILSSMLLRSMKKAIYSTNNIGHFGLASKNYTHFTSPIRRFPDLTVHTLLKTYLFKNDLSLETVNFYSKYLIDVAENSSATEVASIEAERDVLDMKMAEYMMSHIGEVYKGIISTVTSFGFFVELENLVEGLVHISTLNGYYNYVPELLSLVSKENSMKYRIGDEVTVKVTKASKINGTIDFEIFVGEENGDKE
ncbi:MAG: ribonuclease R [Bacilli bacterium]